MSLDHYENLKIKCVSLTIKKIKLTLICHGNGEMTVEENS